MNNILKNILAALFIVLGFFAFQVKAQTIDDFVIRDYLTDEIVRLQQQISALIVQPRVAGATTISTMTVAQTSGSYAFKAQEEKTIGSIVLKATGNDITLKKISAIIRGQLADNYTKLSLVDKAGVVLGSWDSSQSLVSGSYPGSVALTFDLSSVSPIVEVGVPKYIDVVLKAKDSVTNSTQYFQIIGQSIEGVDANGQVVKVAASINIPFISQVSSVLDSQIAQLLSQARTIYTQLLACRIQKGLPYMPFPIPVQNNKEEYLISIHNGLQALQADLTTCQSSEDLNAKIATLQTQINQLWQQIVALKCTTGVTSYVAPLADKNLYVANLLAKIAEFQTLLTKCQNVPTACAKEGEKWTYYEYEPEKSISCCSGLTASGGRNGYLYNAVTQQCVYEGVPTVGTGTCVKCGDRICSVGENKCSCPNDCKTDARDTTIATLIVQIQQLQMQAKSLNCAALSKDYIDETTRIMATISDKDIIIASLMQSVRILQDYIVKCQQPTKYACIGGSCIVSAGGLYGSLSACQASCGQASKYSVELVSANITKISASGVADQADAEIKIRIKNLSGLNIYIDKTADWGAGISGFKIGLSNGLQKIISASVTANVGDYIPGYQTGEYTIKAHILPSLNGYYSLALNFFRIREPSGDVLVPFSPSIYKTNNLYLSTTIQKVCAKEGESWIYDNSSAPNNPNNKSVNCCSGLLKVGGGAIYDSSCRIIGGIAGGGSGTCVKCGNGICDSGENQCNCPSDCKVSFIGKLEMSSYPGDVDKVVQLSSSGATYDVELGKISFKAINSDIKLSQLSGVVSVYNKNGYLKLANTIIQRLHIYDEDGLNIAIATPDIAGNFIFTDGTNIPKYVSQTTGMITTGNPKVLTIKADITSLVTQGDFVTWKVTKAVGIFGSNTAVANNVVYGKKTHLYSVYPSLTLVGTNMTKISGYGFYPQTSDSGDCYITFKIKAVGGDIKIKDNTVINSGVTMLLNTPQLTAVLLSTKDGASYYSPEKSYIIYAGQEKMFQIAGHINPLSSGYYYCYINGFQWDNGWGVITKWTRTNFSPLNDYKTNMAYLNKR